MVENGVSGLVERHAVHVESIRLSVGQVAGREDDSEAVLRPDVKRRSGARPRPIIDHAERRPAHHLESYVRLLSAVAVLCWGQRGTGPPVKSCPGPSNFFQGNLGLTFPHV